MRSKQKSLPAASGDQQAPREERLRLAGIKVTLSWPSKEPKAKGVTFLLPGSMIKISEYNGLRDVILQQNHLVIRFFINVLYPFRNNHRKHAEDVKDIFDSIQALYPNLLPNSYSIVGHSVGATIGLLVASIVDRTRVSAVLALDPVDINPIEFTNARGHNLPLDDDDDDDDDIPDSTCMGSFTCQFDHEDDIVHVYHHRKGIEEHKHLPIVLTCTDGGLGIPKSHDAEAIHKLHPATLCYHHNHAGHMAYCDHGGGWAGKLMPDVGTKDGNEKARIAAHKLIREFLNVY